MIRKAKLIEPFTAKVIENLKNNPDILALLMSKCNRFSNDDWITLGTLMAGDLTPDAIDQIKAIVDSK